jgi:hypothetical protein
VKGRRFELNGHDRRVNDPIIPVRPRTERPSLEALTAAEGAA